MSAEIHPGIDPLLRIKEVQRLTGLAKSSLYMLVSKNRFPAPIKLSERMVAWPESEIREWVQNKISGSRVQVGVQHSDNVA